MLTADSCELCAQDGGAVLWRDGRCRVVLVEDPDYPGYCRVIWNAHVKEMTGLSAGERRHCMDVVFAVEAQLREVLKPDKVNLASFGNVTPHVHWHVIPRFRDDPHFPNPVWGSRTQERASTARADMELAGKLRESLAASLAKSA
jgi:diadenosine tetraphosphate (Ap4A) HIT family hydrolase